MVYWFRESLRLTALVTLATLPLVACYFNQVSWLGLFANLLMVPFVGFIFLPISLLSTLWVIATHSPALPGAELIDELLERLLVHPVKGQSGQIRLAGLRVLQVDLAEDADVLAQVIEFQPAILEELDELVIPRPHG